MRPRCGRAPSGETTETPSLRSSTPGSAGPGPGVADRLSADDLLQLSPKSWNATLYYDDGRFTARASAAHRTTFLTRVPGQNNNDVEGTNESLNVDASISYKITPNFEVVLEGVNLTNEKNDQFISRARNSAVVYNATGREYMFGVRVAFP